jgi:hypothetical protein
MVPVAFAFQGQRGLGCPPTGPQESNQHFEPIEKKIPFILIRIIPLRCVCSSCRKEAPNRLPSEKARA